MDVLTSLLSSRVKSEVLRLLFGIDMQPLHLREIARRSGLNSATVRQELQRLGGLGLIVRTADGNRVQFSASREHPLYADLRSIVLKTCGPAAVLETALADEASIRVAFVFGSIANGTHRPDSDVDILVIGDISLRALTRRLAEASASLSRELNPHVMRVSEFRRRKAVRDHFLSSVLDSPRIFIKGTPDDLEELG